MSNKLILKGFHWNRNQIEERKLTYLNLNLTNSCDYSCLYCYVGDDLNKKIEELSTDERKGLIRVAKDLGVRTIVFTGAGEPTLSEDFYRLIKFNDSQGLHNVVFSNIYRLDNKGIIKFLRNHNTSIVIKIDSLNAKHYDLMTQRRGAFSKFYNNIMAILESYRGTVIEKGDITITPLGANAVVTDINKNDIEEVANFCRQHHIKFNARRISRLGCAIKNWSLLAKNYDDITSLCSTYNDEVGQSKFFNGKCGIFFYGITIDCDGTILGCPEARNIKLGNIRNLSLEEIVQHIQKLPYKCMKEALR